MIIFWKNKGFAVLLYIMFSVIGTMLLAQYLSKVYDFDLSISGRIPFALGIAFFIAAIWTYLTKNDYYKDREGNKVKMEIDNSFFFIKMEYWPYILGVIGFSLMIGSVL
ncbi:MAG: hypothetical protein GQ574_05485 [Crocinitomix sp.]|nr:hypothetical protein [Crocinitomix sp.]